MSKNSKGYFMHVSVSSLNLSRLPDRIKPQFRNLYTNEPKTINQLATNKIHQGDAKILLQQIKPNSIALSVWSPPYFVGKNYESQLTYTDWTNLLKTVLVLHFRAREPVEIPGKLPKIVEIKGNKFITTTVFVKYNSD